MRTLTRPIVLAGLVTTVLALGSGVAIASTTSSPHAPVPAVTSTSPTTTGTESDAADSTATDPTGAVPTTAESDSADGPGGHADTGANADHQFNGNE